MFHAEVSVYKYFRLSNVECKGTLKTFIFKNKFLKHSSPFNFYLPLPLRDKFQFLTTSRNLVYHGGALVYVCLKPLLIISVYALAFKNSRSAVNFGFLLQS